MPLAADNAQAPADDAALVEDIWRALCDDELAEDMLPDEAAAFAEELDHVMGGLREGEEAVGELVPDIIADENAGAEREGACEDEAVEAAAVAAVAGEGGEGDVALAPPPPPPAECTDCTVISASGYLSCPLEPFASLSMLGRLTSWPK